MDKPKLISRYLAEARDIVLACDTDRAVTWTNDAAASGFGLKQSDLIGNDLLDVVEEFSRFLAEGLFQQVLGNEHWHGELLLLRSKEVVFPAYVSASPILDKNGNVERVLFIAQDISERKKLEEGIRKNTELASSIIRTAPVGIFTLDMDWKFTAVNKAFADMVGVKNPNLLLEESFKPLGKDINPELVMSIENSMLGLETSVINKSLGSGGAGDLTVSLVAVPLRDPYDNVEAILVLLENRTELVRVEEQLFQADKLASTGFLAAGIAHEINNPLAGIHTVIETLAKRVRREGGNEEPYQRILANIDRVKDIIRRLLEFANPSAIQAQKSDLNNLVIQVLEFFKFHPIFRRVSVEWDLDEDLPEVVVDPRQIQQIIHNLAMNAAQAMKDEGGELVISSKLIESTKESRRWIEISIRDTGTGIPEADLRRIFDPFFTTKPPGEGTGLGLSVSYSIAKNHGGELLAKNHPEGGAEFILRLPG